MGSAEIAMLFGTTRETPSTFYISAAEGNDTNDGLSPATPWQTLSKVNAREMIPGDSLLFRSGDTFVGRLTIISEGGNESLPVVITSYGSGAKPILDGDGYLSAVLIQNSSHIHLSNLEITNENEISKPGVSEDKRYGIYFENTYSDGTTFDHYQLERLTFRNIYQTTQISDNDQTGINAHAITSTGSWGDEIHPIRFRNMRIEHCYFTGTSRHAVVLKAVENLELRHNLIQHVGGAGIVVAANSRDVLVEYNTTDHTGSGIDPRMAGRGSGIWCFKSKNVVVQYNKFLYARGIKDSYGMHIDHSNRNVVYQYNYSEGNEGGFVEILGNNINVGYRYNVSIGDGWRKRGPTYGQIFWFTGWAGDPQNPLGSDSIFVYNNSIFIPDTIQPGIFIKAAKHTRVCNNIIYASNGFGDVVINNDPDLNEFDHNLWYGTFPDFDTQGRPYRGEHAVYQNPLFKKQVVTDSAGFILRIGSPAIGTGRLMLTPGIDHQYDYFHNHGGEDYYRNPVSETNLPNIGAFNGEAHTGLIPRKSEAGATISLYPNPVKADQPIVFKMPDQFNNKTLHIQIVDLEGKILFEKTLQSNGDIQLVPEPLVPGNYLIKIQAGDSLSSNQLIVI